MSYLQMYSIGVCITVFHDHRCESNRSVVVKASEFRLFGDGNDGGAFVAAGNFAQLHRSVEDLYKDRGQLVSTEF